MTVHDLVNKGLSQGAEQSAPLWSNSHYNDGMRLSVCDAVRYTLSSGSPYQTDPQLP